MPTVGARPNGYGSRCAAHRDAHRRRHRGTTSRRATNGVTPAVVEPCNQRAGRIPSSTLLISLPQWCAVWRQREGGPYGRRRGPGSGGGRAPGGRVRFRALDDYFACFADDATFVFYTTPQRLESVDAYRQLWDRWVRDDGFRVTGCVSSAVRVQVLGDAAVMVHDVVTDVETRVRCRDFDTYRRFSSPNRTRFGRPTGRVRRLRSGFGPLARRVKATST
jgi:hypothetical protein